MLKYNHIVFDLDGTLIDTLPDVVYSLNFALSEYVSDKLNCDKVIKWIGYGLEHLIIKSLEYFDIDLNCKIKNDVSRIFLLNYEENIGRSKLFEDVRVVLDALRNVNAQMSICSNKPVKMINLVLDVLNLRNYFVNVSGGDSFEFKKPDPRHLYSTLSVNKVDQCANYLIVGDSESDIELGSNVGIDTVLVTYGYMKDASLKKQATFCIDEISDLIDIILVRKTNV